MKTRIKRQVLDLTPDQIRALHVLVASDDWPVGKKVTGKIHIEQTKTRPGGTHLYVALEDGEDRWVHVGQKGQLTECEGAFS